MRMQEFFEHHGLVRNPFADEDAQSDPVFKQVMASAVFHPAWDKIFGRSEEVGTAIVFGEKGSGKTALRLQIQEHLAKHNHENPDKRIFIVQYDNFNPLLDRFNEVKGRKGRECLEQWELWDHVDSILSIGVSSLVDRLTGTGNVGSEDTLAIDLRRAARMNAMLKRDLLLLAAYYDRSRQAPFLDRWNRLAGRLRYGTMLARWPDLVGWVGSAVSLFTFVNLVRGDYTRFGEIWFWLVMGVMFGASWAVKLKKLWRLGRLASKITRSVSVVQRHAKELRIALSSLWESAIHDQPLPIAGLSDSRYQLLSKFTVILQELGFAGTIVLMDRIDEPQLINGNPEAMRDFVWPILDNKLLKQPGIGFKMLLPIELSHFLSKESKEFYERSRLDKQNTVRSLEWSGQALYDMASERLTASLPRDRQEKGEKLPLRHMIDDELGTSEIIHSLDYLRVPRHLFKFLYRLITDHCNTYTSDQPEWKIKATVFQSTLKLYMRDLEAFDKGYGHG